MEGLYDMTRLSETRLFEFKSCKTNIIVFELKNIWYFLFMVFLFYYRETLMSIAKHFETGESLPEEVYLKLVAARTFRAGSLSLRQVSVNVIAGYSFL